MADQLKPQVEQFVADELRKAEVPEWLVGRLAELVATAYAKGLANGQAPPNGGWIKPGDSEASMPHGAKPVQFVTRNGICVGRRRPPGYLGAKDAVWSDELGLDMHGDPELYSDEQVQWWAPLLEAPKP